MKLAYALSILSFGAVLAPSPLVPIAITDPVEGDADDPAIWVHPSDPSESLIIGTDKVPMSEGGGLYVFGLNGKLRQARVPLENPNNVDVEQDVRFNGKPWDLAVATERGKRRLAIFRIDRSSGRLSPASGSTKVFTGQLGERGAPMGIALYKRPKDGALFAIVSRKEGPEAGYLAQYRLVANPKGLIDARWVRNFGNCGAGGEIEALLVDDELGFVYAAEEKFGIRKYAADPDSANPNRELAVFGRTGFPEDREGLGLYATGPGAGYILCSDQRANSSWIRIFPRGGNDHAELGAVATDCDGTDGLESVSASLGPRFPNGMVATMNSMGKNFKLYRWEDVAKLSGLHGR